MGIRPKEKVLCNPTDPGTIVGGIELNEDVGAEDHVSVVVAGLTCMVRTSTHQTARKGERVGLRLPIEVLHLFDAEGVRIEGAEA